MTPPEYPREVSVENWHWLLKFEVADVARVAKEWQSLASKLEDSAESILRQSRLVLESGDWSGLASQEFDGHRLEVIRDLEEMRDSARTTADLLGEVVYLAECYEKPLQQTMEHLLSSLRWRRPGGRSWRDQAGETVFTLHNEQEDELLRTALAQVSVTRSDYDSRLQEVAGKFSTDPWETISVKWQRLARGYDVLTVDGPPERFPVDPFTTPPTPAGTSRITSPEGAIIKTDVPISSVTIEYDETRNMSVLVVDDKQYWFNEDPDARVYLMTQDGQVHGVFDVGTSRNRIAGQ